MSILIACLSPGQTFEFHFILSLFALALQIKGTLAFFIIKFCKFGSDLTSEATKCGI